MKETDQNSFNLKNVRFCLGVAAGKGGVGKSMLTLNLALVLAQKGWRIGIIDADVYGPSFRKMLPEDRPPRQHPHTPERMYPAEKDLSGVLYPLKFISMAHFFQEGSSIQVRAPIANGIIKQFIHLVEWGELDCLLIDFPPGTGDIPLTLMQEALLSGGIVVTTPQEVALIDVSKAVEMFRHLEVPLMGLVENMSYFQQDFSSPKCYPFGQGGGRRLAREEGLPFLGEVPLASEISQCCDQGISLFEKNPETSAAQALKEIAQEVVEQLEAFSALEGECLGGSKIIHQNSHSFCVEWSDGEKSEYSFKEILPHCRCVRCKKTPPAFFEGEVEANGIQKVGRFGVRIQFKQGCSKGIYSFEFLRHFRQVQG